MEGFSTIGKKVMPALAAVAMACSTEGKPDEQMSAALATLQKETDDLVMEFEFAASKAMSTRETFEEQGSSSGEVILVDHMDTYGCMKSSDGDGVICEKTKFKGLSVNPNKVSLDRGESTIIVADKTNVQVVRRYDKGEGQSASTMTFNANNCNIHNAKESGSNSTYSVNEDMIKRCANLRDMLKGRLQAVMTNAAAIKNNFRNP